MQIPPRPCLRQFPALRQEGVSNCAYPVVVRQTSPAARDRAQRRVRSITIGTAVTAGVLTVAGAAATAGTFAGRTVNAAQSPTTPTDPNAAAPTVDPNTGLQPPAQVPADNSGGGGFNQPPVVTGGS